MTASEWAFGFNEWHRNGPEHEEVPAGAAGGE